MKHACYVCGDYNVDLIKVKTNKHYCELFDEVILQGFIPKITLPIRIAEQSGTLIDNICTCNIDEKESSGILLNHISDHHMAFTIIENLSYVIRVPKFIEIEKNDLRSIQNCVNELEELNIYDELTTSVNSDLKENYDIMLKLLATAKKKHLPKKMKKLDKRNIKRLSG